MADVKRQAGGSGVVQGGGAESAGDDGQGVTMNAGEHEELMTQMRALTDERDQLTGQLENAQAQKESAEESLRQQIEAANAETVECKQELETKTEMMHEVQKKYKKGKDEIAELAAKLEAAETEVGSCMKEVHHMTTSLYRLKTSRITWKLS